MDEIRENMRRANLVDDLVHQIDSPFMASINSYPLPPKFKMPWTHMMEHATLFIILLLSILQCTFRGFQMRSCVGPSLLPQRANTSVVQQDTSKYYEFFQRHKRSSSNLLTIEQGENESLWSFITHFNREALTVDEMDDKLLLVAFHNGVHFDLFIHKFYEQGLQTLAELVHSAQNFMNAEDAIIAKKRKRAK